MSRLDFACELHTAGAALDVTPSSGVSYGGGPGGAGVETRGSDVVEVASPTSLRFMSSIGLGNAEPHLSLHLYCEGTVQLHHTLKP